MQPETVPTPEPPAAAGGLPAARPDPSGGEAALLARLEAHAADARGAFADNTLRALASDTRVFSAWCRAEGRVALPAESRTVAEFVDAQAASKSRATIERYRSSIAALHRAAGAPNPCADEVVRLAIRRVSRGKGRRQRQAEPLNRPGVDRMIERMTTARTHRRVAEAGREVPLVALRNAALFAVGYDTLLRRSELVALAVEDVRAAADGSGSVLVRRSKADQEGEGAVKYLAVDTFAHVSAWIGAAGLDAGPLFRPLTKGGRVKPGALGAAEVARLFRDVAGAAGVRLARAPSGHSMRVGATQDMFAAGFELPEVMQAGSWKTPAMPARYGERLRAQRGAARKLAALQNRS